MEDKRVGEINTPFISARLPRWAGVRQNVTGSDISGFPVASPEGGSSQVIRSRKTIETVTTEESQPMRVPVLPPDPMMNAILHVNTKIEELVREVMLMKQSIHVLQTKVDDIGDTLEEEMEEELQVLPEYETEEVVPEAEALGPYDPEENELPPLPEDQEDVPDVEGEPSAGPEGREEETNEL